MKNPSVLFNKTSAQDSLETALYILQDGIAFINRDKIITYINKAAQQIFERQLNYRPNVGDDFLSVVQAERKESISHYIEEAFNNKATVFELNYPQDGHESWFEIGYYPMPDASGVITDVCVRAKNITDKVLLERQLEKQRQTQKNNVIKAALDAQEKERSQIGKELHDNVNQVLTTVKLYNEICLNEAVPNKSMLQKSIQQINYCIEIIRGLSKRLSTPGIEDMGLVESIKELIDSINTTRKIQINFYSFGIKDHMISQDLQISIFRIAQEQLTNILKHANAKTVDFMIVGTSLNIAMRIQDDGDGFDLNQKRNGVGITNMISRAQAWEGEIEFKSFPGKGCTLMVEFPLIT